MIRQSSTTLDNTSSEGTAPDYQFVIPETHNSVTVPKSLLIAGPDGKLLSVSTFGAMSGIVSVTQDGTVRPGSCMRFEHVDVGNDEYATIERILRQQIREIGLVPITLNPNGSITVVKPDSDEHKKTQSTE